MCKTTAHLHEFNETSDVVSYPVVSLEHYLLYSWLVTVKRSCIMNRSFAWLQDHYSVVSTACYCSVRNNL